MTALPLDRDTVLRRMNGIQEDIRELETLSHESYETFCDGVGFKLAQFHLHRALEGVFHIASHLLSRIPGGQVTEYKAMARKLGELKIVDRAFADESLVNMAGYRNRLVHFYAEITPMEMHKLLRHELHDIETFLAAVKRVLERPEDFGISASSL